MKLIRSIFLLSLFIAPFGVSAASSLSITEIMYDLSGSDAGHEWVELYNNSSQAVSIVGGSGAGSWRFNDGSNHFLAQTPAMGSLTIPSGGYVILADDAQTFLNDHPNFSGTLIDTTISLPNTSGVVKIIDGDGNVIDSVSYTSSQGASGDGNTLQLSGTSWIAASPTPNAPTAGSSSSNSSTTSTSTTTTAPATSPTPTKTLSNTVAYETPRMQAVVNAPISATVGIPIKISAVVYGTAKEYRQAGVFHFALGDGTQYDSTTPPTFEHTYTYEGQYVLMFDYRTTTYMQDSEVSFRQVIDVSAPSVAISLVKPDGSVVLKNGSDDDADISGWWIEQGDMKNQIPKGTIILAGKSATLRSTESQIAQTASLLLPSGQLVSSYGMSTTPPLAVDSSPVTKASVPILVSGSSNTTPKEVASVAPALLSAQALKATQYTDTAPIKKKKSIAPFIVGLVGIITASFFILKKEYSHKKAQTETEDVQSPTQALADSIRIVEE